MTRGLCEGDDAMTGGIPEPLEIDPSSWNTPTDTVQVFISFVHV